MTDWLSPRTAPVSLGGRNTTPHSRVLTRESRLRQFDWVLNIALALLLVLGVLLVWGATHVTLSGKHSTSYLKKDLLNLVIGVGLGVGTSLLDYRSLRAYAPVVYVASLLGLLAVLSPIGATINGAKSWIVIGGGFTIQPAEFAKIALVIGLAMYLGEKRDSGDAPRHVDVAWGLVLASVPLGLVLLQPDLGTAVVLGFMILAAIAVSGAPTRWIAGMMLVAILGGFAVVESGRLHGYQKARFTVFFNPNATDKYSKVEKDDPQHAQIAIGSGGLLGKGLLNGPLTNDHYVHATVDDFIFSVAGEELGFVGAVGIVGLLGVVLWRAFRIAAKADDAFGRLMAVSIIAWFSFQAFENIGMCLGIMPVTGLPLPFISYGGSSMFVNLIAMGLLQNVHMHSQTA
ncbi:rod shape-determining protein RodA [Acidothermaceae bacterium B102]|nr:rod shape-determining protein RodA [Acidothermaceae bacterium B102]